MIKKSEVHEIIGLLYWIAGMQMVMIGSSEVFNYVGYFVLTISVITLGVGCIQRYKEGKEVAPEEPHTS